MRLSEIFSELPKVDHDTPKVKKIFGELIWQLSFSPSERIEVDETAVEQLTEWTKSGIVKSGTIDLITQFLQDNFQYCYFDGNEELKGRLKILLHFQTTFETQKSYTDKLSLEDVMEQVVDKHAVDVVSTSTTAPAPQVAVASTATQPPQPCSPPSSPISSTKETLLDAKPFLGDSAKFFSLESLPEMLTRKLDLGNFLGEASAPTFAPSFGSFFTTDVVPVPSKVKPILAYMMHFAPLKLAVSVHSHSRLSSVFDKSTLEHIEQDFVKTAGVVVSENEGKFKESEIIRRLFDPYEVFEKRQAIQGLRRIALKSQDDQQKKWAQGVCLLLGLLGQAKDVGEGMKVLMKLQHRDCTYALLTMAYYYMGLGGNRKFACSLFRELAENQHDALAQVVMGLCYEKGLIDGKKRVSKARNFYMLATNQGYSFAQFIFGLCCEEEGGGQVVTAGVASQNVQKAAALEWYRLAAVQGCSLAQAAWKICYGCACGAECGEGGGEIHSKAF